MSLRRVDWACVASGVAADDFTDQVVTLDTILGGAVAAAIDRVTPTTVSRVAFVAREVSGRHALAIGDERAGMSIPAVDLRPGERVSDGLARCIVDRVGVVPRAVYPIETPWQIDWRETAIFGGLSALAASDAGSTGSRPALHWADDAEAHAILSTAPPTSASRRDLVALSSLRRVSLSAERRLLLTLRVLHRMGFERLRCAVERAPDRTFAFELCPPPDAAPVAYAAMRPTLSWPSHRSVLGQSPFGWDDACFDDPDRLAAKLVARAPDLLYSAWGTDPRYARWLDESLDTTECEGVILTGSDTPSPPGTTKVERHKTATLVVEAPPRPTQ